MKVLAFIFVFVSFSGVSQNDEFQVWTEIGVKQKIIKRLDYQFELNTRIGGSGIETFFPQLGLKYKVAKWFSPSIEYRFLVDKNKYGNYKTGSRININANFDYSVNRLQFELRGRYQFAFSGVKQSEYYNPDFDQAIRFKPSISYDINNSIFTPEMSTEFFFFPGSGGPYYPGFTKVRFALGSSLELKGPHRVSFKYQLDKRLHDQSKGLRHVASVSYSYKIKKKK